MSDRDQTGAQIAIHTSPTANSATTQATCWQLSSARLNNKFGIPANLGPCVNASSVTPIGPLSSGPLLTMPRSDGYSLGPYSIQGARVYDDTSSQWTTPDAYKGAVDDPMSQKPYMWNNNNAVSYSDPTGFAPLFNDYVYGDLDDSLLKQSFESGASTSAQQQSTLAQEVPPEEEKEEPNGVPPADANANLWAGGQENMQEHFEKHGDEFPGATIDDYTAIGFGLYYQAEHNPGEPQAEVFIKEAAGLNASQTRYLIYNADTNVFGAYTSEGKIITVFKPKSPDYFFQQRGVEIPSVPLPAIP